MYRNKGDRKKLTQILGYSFENESLLLQALTRTSALNEGYQVKDIGDFQRLEFIGDKVLNLIISDIIFDNYPDWKEGQLTSEVSNFTRNDGPLAAIARNLQLGDFLIMGIGEERNNRARENTKVLSDALEALIGAIWIDSENDYKFLRKFITQQFKVLNLLDFNKEYEEYTIKYASKVIVQEAMDDFMSSALPEIWEVESGRHGVTGAESTKHIFLQQRATKPLKGVAASLNNFLQKGNTAKAQFEDVVEGEEDKSETQPSFS